MRLVQERAGHRHLGVCKDRIPPCFLVAAPLPYALAVGRPRRGGHVIDKAAQSLAQCKHPQAFALSRPVQQRVELRPEGLADRGRDGHEFLRELIDRVAEAVAETRLREKGPHALDSTVEAISEDPPDAIGWLLLERSTLEFLIGLGKGYRTGLRGIAQVPDHTATHNRRQIHLVCQTVAVLLIGQEVGGQGEPTPRQYWHQPLVAKRTDQTIEGHGRDMIEHRTQF